MTVPLCSKFLCKNDAKDELVPPLRGCRRRRPCDDNMISYYLSRGTLIVGENVTGSSKRDHTLESGLETSPHLDLDHVTLKT